MPGLIRGVARTAVIAGTATAVSGRVQRRQQGRWAAQEAQAQQQYADQQPAYAAPAPAAAPAATPTDSAMDDKIARLRELGQLKEQGILTQAEFDAQKAVILAS